MAENYFLIDNNLLHQITRIGNEQSLHNWWADLDANNISKGGSVIQPVVTSFVLLEAVGVKIRNSPPILPETVFEDMELSSVGALVYDHAYAHFKSLPEITPENMKAKFEEAKKYRSTEGFTLFDAVIHKNFEHADFTSDICQSLALDYLFQYQYPALIGPKLHQIFWLVLNDCLQKGINLSYYRVIKRMWEQLSQKKREELFGLENFIQLSKSFKMDSKEDYLDTELIHFAVIGKYFSGSLEAVQCFTMDDEQTIRHRISLYKMVLQVIREKFEESKLSTDAFLHLKPGKVHIYGPNGKRISEIDVSCVKVLEA